MKIVTVLGTRPEIIRLSRVIIERSTRTASTSLVHTGQNYDAEPQRRLLRASSACARPTSTSASQASSFARAGRRRSSPESTSVLRAERARPPADPRRHQQRRSPRSCAKRMGIPVFHMEAGNRCYDDRVPEEVNRRIIDHCSDVLMPYTSAAARTCSREGIEPASASSSPAIRSTRCWSTTRDADRRSATCSTRSASSRAATSWSRCTAPRTSTTPARLRGARRRRSTGVAERYGLPLVCQPAPAHRRPHGRRSAIAGRSARVRAARAARLLRLRRARARRAAACSRDSGTVQEECCIFGVPNVTLRDVTERPETIECGSNILTGADPDRDLAARRAPSWPRRRTGRRRPSTSSRT